MGKILYPDYFPVCIPKGAPSPAKNYLSLSLRQAMTLFWRVKRWEGRLSGGYVEEGEFGQIYTTTFSGGGSYSQLNPFFFFPSEEMDLVCSYGQFYFSRDAGSYVTQSDAYYGAGNVILSFYYSFNESEAFSDGSTIFPSFTVYGAGSSSGNGGQVGTYTLSFNGYTESRPLYTAYGSVNSGSVSIDIRAVEYWSYGGTYDTATGRPL
jgi:hypothetical protein